MDALHPRLLVTRFTETFRFYDTVLPELVGATLAKGAEAGPYAHWDVDDQGVLTLLDRASLAATINLTEPPEPDPTSTPSEVASSGVAPSGVASSGVAPSGVASSGGASSGAAPSGGASSGVASAAVASVGGASAAGGTSAGGASARGATAGVAPDAVMFVCRVADVDAGLTRCLAAGGSLVAPAADRPEWGPGLRTAHLRDPEGNLIELQSY